MVTLLGVRNNIEFLRRIVSTEDFSTGKLDTGFLDRHGELFAVPGEVPIEAVLVASLQRDVTVSALDQRLVFPSVWNSGPWRNS